MWNQLLDLFRLFFTMAEELKKLQADIKEHSQQIRELTASQSRLYFEFQLWKEREERAREREAHEREKDAMRLEIRQLRERMERLSLPSPPDEPDRSG
jgi:SMC interacting uncharacterized protein involved in chromosome segregation